MSTISKFKITTPIRAILLNNPGIYELVGENIFPIVAPKDTKGDFIIYRRDGFSSDSTKMGVFKQTPSVYINAISDSYDRSQELAELIYTTLEGTFSNPDMKITLADSTEEFAEEFESEKYIQVLLFNVE